MVKIFLNAMTESSRIQIHSRFSRKTNSNDSQATNMTNGGDKKFEIKKFFKLLFSFFFLLLKTFNRVKRVKLFGALTLKSIFIFLMES